MVSLRKTIANFDANDQPSLARQIQESMEGIPGVPSGTYLRVAFEPATVSNAGAITITKDFGSGLDVKDNAIPLETGVYRVSGSAYVRSSSGTNGIALGFEVLLDGQRQQRFFARRYSTNTGSTLQPKASLLLDVTKPQRLSFAGYTGGLYSVEFTTTTGLSSFADVEKVA
jgi:hypothetical protein